MGKYYQNENNVEQKNVNFGVRILANTLAILAAGSFVTNMYIDGIIYAFIAGFLLSLVNAFIKPFLVIVTLPITVITLGLFYPIINIFLINFVDFIMGDHFEITGIIEALILSLIIAILNYAVTHVRAG